MNTDNEQNSLDETGASIEQDMGGHPLFSRPETETGPDKRKFDIIEIHRWLPDGTKEICPRTWKGSELRRLDQVTDSYGGGCTYQFVAKDERTHQFQAYSPKYYVGSPALKPFTPEPKRINESAAQPQVQQPPALDVTMLVKFMLEREARTAEAQAKVQETLLRIALERPAPPNPFETMRDAMQLMQGMNTQQTAANNGSDPVKMLERGIAMGKDMAGGDGGAGEEKIPWGGLVEAATVGLSLLKKKNDKEDAKPAKTEEKPKAEPQKTESPAPAAAPLPQIMFDPATGMPYTFIAGLGFVRLDPAVVLAQMFGHHSPPTPPQYPYGYPFGMPNAPVTPPVAYPYAPMAVPQAPMPPAPMPQAAPMPQPAPMPPVPMPQAAPIAPPPATTRMVQVAAPLPRPVAPPLPPPPPPPPTVRSARLQPDAAPAQPVQVPTTRKRYQKPASAPPKQPKAVPRQTSPHIPPAPPTMPTSGVPPSSEQNGADLPDDAFDEFLEGMPELGDDFAQVVHDGMNSPMAQQIMQDPRYLALRDAVVKGEMSVDDVNDEFVHVLFGSKGGRS